MLDLDTTEPDTRSSQPSTSSNTPSTIFSLLLLSTLLSIFEVVMWMREKENMRTALQTLIQTQVQNTVIPLPKDNKDATDPKDNERATEPGERGDVEPTEPIEPTDELSETEVNRTFRLAQLMLERSDSREDIQSRFDLVAFFVVGTLVVATVSLFLLKKKEILPNLASVLVIVLGTLVTLIPFQLYFRQEVLGKQKQNINVSSIIKKLCESS